MLGRGKKASRFEDSDAGHVPRPRAVSELPRRAAPRVARMAAAGSEASAARHRAPGVGVGRGTSSPRSPLHEKKAVAVGAGASAGAGAGPRVAELEAKLGKAHDQLAAMREQLAAAEKARKDARGAFVEATERSAANKRDGATWTPVDGDVPAEQEQLAEVVTATDAVNGGDEERGGVVVSMPAMAGVVEPSAPGNGEAQVDQDANKTTGDDDEVKNVAIVAHDDGGKEDNPEADELRMKLVAKDKEVYELRAKLMVKDMEVDELRVQLAANDTDTDALTAKLVAKDAEIGTLRADNADLMMISEAAEETAAKARGVEHELRESAAREARLAERLRASERARETLEAEAQRVRVQSEQWRKAAEEAAAVLDGANRTVDAGARRGAETGKDRRRLHSSAGSNVAHGERVDRQQRDADDETDSGGKRKSGATGVAMRVFSELWKKRGQK